MHSISKRNFLRCIKKEIAEQPSPDMPQNISVPFVEAQIFSNLDTSLQTVYKETNNILQPSDQLVDNSRTTFSSNNNINDNDHPLNSDHFDNEKKTSLDLKLSKWTMEYHVSHNCVNALLEILISEGHDLPRTARTLLKTPKLKDHRIISVHPGSYIHFGVEFMMSKILMKHLDSFDKDITIELGMNVDGLPITSSSKSSLWPILISFVNIQHLSKVVIPVGLYHGKFKKPTSSHDYLNQFINEMKNILSYGITINDIILKFKIVQIVCDAPAKAFILNVKGHNAYHGCNSCTVEGDFINNRMAYLNMDAPLRNSQISGKKG